MIFVVKNAIGISGPEGHFPGWCSRNLSGYGGAETSYEDLPFRAYQAGVGEALAVRRPRRQPRNRQVRAQRREAVVGALLPADHLSNQEPSHNDDYHNG